MPPSENGKRAPASPTNVVEEDTLGVATTMDTFAARMKRKMREKEDKDLETQRASAARHGLILQSINLCRKALQEASKIDLGHQFCFEVDVTDFEGWPRLELQLIDEEDPENRECCLLVSAHDRNETGTITFTMRSGEVLGRVLLTSELEINRLPLILKRAVRQFLDRAAQTVFDRQSRPKADPTFAPKMTEPPEERDPVEQELHAKDLFSGDTVVPDRNVVDVDDSRELPVLSVD
jgi:hypothetical protein